LICIIPELVRVKERSPEALGPAIYRMKIARRRCAWQYLDILPVKGYSPDTGELIVVSGVTFLLKTFVGSSEFPFSD